MDYGKIMPEFRHRTLHLLFRGALPALSRLAKLPTVHFGKTTFCSVAGLPAFAVRRRRAGLDWWNLRQPARPKNLHRTLKKREEAIKAVGVYAHPRILLSFWKAPAMCFHALILTVHFRREE